MEQPGTVALELEQYGTVALELEHSGAVALELDQTAGVKQYGAAAGSTKNRSDIPRHELVPLLLT